MKKKKDLTFVFLLVMYALEKVNSNVNFKLIRLHH